MSDTEAINLIEFYRWTVTPTLEGKWAIDGDFGSIRAENLRDGIRHALTEQWEWALAASQS